MKKPNYSRTFTACLLGNFVQAIVINMIAIIFVPVMRLYNLSFGSLGTLVLINFLTQVAFDILLCRLPDKYGFKPFALLGTGFVVVGFIVFALSPVLFPNRVFIGFIVGTLIFSAAGGILELLLSPLTVSLPIEKKSLGILHSFYAWGFVATVLVSSLLVSVLPAELWFITPLFWTIFPLIAFFMFLFSPIPEPKVNPDQSKMRKLFLNPIYILCLLSIFSGGASEVIVAQWSSTFTQIGLGIDKLTGDLLGPCLFAVSLALVRVFQGKYESKLNINKLLILSSMLTIVGYLGITLTKSSALSIASIILCGFSTSLLWPGTLAVAGKAFPMAGAWIYALLAAAGDIGAATAPYLTGFVIDKLNTIEYLSTALSYGMTLEELALKAAILICIIFPILNLFINIFLNKKIKKVESFLKIEA